ncbi:AMP-binding protein [Cumulibacter soli]|uniref:AMP-binding protein n=1 Tax=Cumulibacter soli TaxID=2546344 RepID=UPI001067FA65|nr:AMP-binding protein [Cumulibacter soli]
MESHLANIFESMADAIGDRPALVHGELSRTWSDFDRRAAQIATGLGASGLQVQSKVAFFLYNGPQYLEAQYGALKARFTPVNINYRYRDAELFYLLDNSDAEALFYHSSLASTVEAVRERIGKAKLLVQVPDDDTELLDGAVDYESFVAAYDPMPRIERSADDIFLLYTGGTTGMPKGVMFECRGWAEKFPGVALGLAGRDPETPLDKLAEVAASLAPEERLVTLPSVPLMHGTGLTYGALLPQTLGATVVTLTNRSLDAHELLRAIETNRVSTMSIVGDALSKPIIRAIDEGVDGRGYDLSSLRNIYSSGTMWSSEVKQQLLDRMPNVQLSDIMNASEGAMATQVTTREGGTATARFVPNPATKVFTEDLREVLPGSGEVGLLAASGGVPIGYYKDPVKTAETFREIDGERYAFPGDMATIEADGTITLLGRGSQVINTGGEKVFREEVEEAVKRVAGVRDCLVVGVEDDAFGNAVTAVVAREDGADVSDGEIRQFVRNELASYKAPKHVVFVDDVPRAPNGKADHKTAKALAESRLA